MSVYLARKCQLGSLFLKAVPSFLSIFKTPSIGPTPEIEPVTSRSAVIALPTDLILPRSKC